MKRFTIFGNPIEHSKSPLMHNAAFKALGVDAVYEKTLLLDGSKLKSVFLENNFSGANITVPYKFDAFEQADILDDYALKIGSVNTWVLKENNIYGYNTDAPGFYESIKEFDAKKVLLIGAGGTAKAIEVVLLEKGYNVDILNRSDKSNLFKSDFFTWDSFKAKKYDLVINSTSAGLKDDLLPAPKDIIEPVIKDSKYIVDCIYAKDTPFLKLAKKYDKIYKDGTDMLLYQGVLALELFLDRKIDKNIINIMKQQLI